VTGRLLGEKRAYAHGHDRPPGSFLIIMGAYGTAVTGMAAVLAAGGRRLPDRLAWSGLALVAVATHKVARQLAQDPVTSLLRAPFTRYSGTSAEAELAEEVRGGGMRHAPGELVSCPFCLGQWVATTGVCGLIVVPRTTRGRQRFRRADGLRHAPVRPCQAAGKLKPVSSGFARRVPLGGPYEGR
jgi:hypothetical protein